MADSHQGDEYIRLSGLVRADDIQNATRFPRSGSPMPASPMPDAAVKRRQRRRLVDAAV